MVDYAEHAIGAGADATAVAYVETVDGDGALRWGVGADPNIITASLRAVVCARRQPPTGSVGSERLAAALLPGHPSRLGGSWSAPLRARRAGAGRVADPDGEPGRPPVAAPSPRRCRRRPVDDPVERRARRASTVKVKLASGIYHLPGMFAYDRTIPDRCYASAEAAEADGFRAAKR